MRPQGGFPQQQPVYPLGQAQKQGMPQLPTYQTAASPHSQRPGMQAAGYSGGQAPSPLGEYPPGQGPSVPGVHAAPGSGTATNAPSGPPSATTSSAATIYQLDRMTSSSAAARLGIRFASAGVLAASCFHCIAGSKMVWQGDIMFAQSILHTPSAVHLMYAHALVMDSPTTANLVLQWPPMLASCKSFVWIDLCPRQHYGTVASCCSLFDKETLS